ncbi:acyltransferase family protein [Chitinophaga sp. NPDC101104]|uniref:acyltransferase family protein n=1 Tax=Chitinophaga sp. NPDC101104 TaxID=3390561 RepID=UPI003CFCDA7B
MSQAPHTASSGQGRISSMDALRALAMFLGVGLHAAMPYTYRPFEGLYHDPYYADISYDYIFFFIHIFRMQLFYVIAGFFFRLLFLKIGTRPFIRHRAQRILIPFVVGLFTILPLTYLPSAVARVSEAGMPWNWATVSAVLKDIFTWRGPLHLWFLYYLSILYAGGLVVYHLMGSGAAKRLLPLKFIHGDFSPGGILLLMTAASYMSLWMFASPFVEYAPGLVPKVSFLTYYGIFFFAGWVLHHHMKRIFPLLKRYALPFTLAGVVVGCVVGWAKIDPAAPEVNRALLQAGATAATICLVTGVAGVFLRWVNAERPAVRYLSDASYWVYLVHVGLLGAVQMYIGQFRFWGPAKYALALGVTIAVSLATYQWWVRYTKIGFYLHGPRKRPAVGALPKSDVHGRQPAT